MHQRDNRKLIETLVKLRDLGNTVLVVEHDEETMRSADWLIELGPGAGEHGGEIVAQGTVEESLRSDCLTAEYLRGANSIAIQTATSPEKPCAGLAISRQTPHMVDRDLEGFAISPPPQAQPRGRFLTRRMAVQTRSGTEAEPRR